MKFDKLVFKEYSERKNLRVGIVKKNKHINFAPSIENVLGEIEKDFKGTHTFVEFDFD
jgi:hypothetical protein